MASSRGSSLRTSAGAFAAGALFLVGCGRLIGGDGYAIASGAGGSAGPAQMIEVPAKDDVFLASIVGAHPAKLDYDFMLDELEVSVERFSAWFDAGLPVPKDGESLDPGGPYAATMLWNDLGRCQGDPGCVGGSWKTAVLNYDFKTPTVCDGTYTRAAPHLPMTCVNWYQAVAMCAFEGKRLPTETELQYEAQAGDEARVFPFVWNGAPLRCDQAIFDDGSRCQFPIDGGSARAGASKHGALDLAGSVSEWMWDAWGFDTYPDDATNYAGPAVTTLDQWKVRRGGSFSSSDASTSPLRNDQHEYNDARNVFNNAGFRCAKSLP